MSAYKSNLYIDPASSEPGMIENLDVREKFGEGFEKYSDHRIITFTYLLLVVRQHLIGSQVLTRCPPLFVVHGIQAVVESRSSREIDNIPQI